MLSKKADRKMDATEVQSLAFPGFVKSLNFKEVDIKFICAIPVDLDGNFSLDFNKQWPKNPKKAPKVS